MLQPLSRHHKAARSHHVGSVVSHQHGHTFCDAVALQCLLDVAGNVVSCVPLSSTFKNGEQLALAIWEHHGDAQNAATAAVCPVVCCHCQVVVAVQQLLQLHLAAGKLCWQQVLAHCGGGRWDVAWPQRAAKELEVWAVGHLAAEQAGNSGGTTVLNSSQGTMRATQPFQIHLERQVVAHDGPHEVLSGHLHLLRQQRIVAPGCVALH